MLRAVAFVRADPGMVNVTVPGPFNTFHSTTNFFSRGSPSSCALPKRLTSSPNIALSVGGGPLGRAVTPRTRTVGGRLRHTPFGTFL